jgi:hypothetical protein
MSKQFSPDRKNSELIDVFNDAIQIGFQISPNP